MKPSLDIDHICALARLRLTDEEKKVLEPQVAEIVAWIGKLEEVKLPVHTEGPESHLSFPLPLRTDAVRASQPLETALLNAPDKAAPFIKVPKVIEEK